MDTYWNPTETFQKKI